MSEMRMVESVKRSNSGKTAGPDSLVGRIAAARAVLGEDGTESPEIALERERAAAAEAYVLDLERKAERKIAAQRAAAEKAKLAEEKAEARLKKILPARPPISTMDGQDILIVAALKKIDVNTLIVGWLQAYLDADPRPELRLQESDVRELSSGGGARLTIGITNAMLAALQEAAQEFPPPRENANYRNAMLMAAIIRAGLARELAEADPEAVKLVRRHHGLIRESASMNNYAGWRDGVWPAGVSVESVRRYQETCGRYAEELALNHQIFAGVRSQGTLEAEAARQREEQERARAAKAAEQAAVEAEQRKLRALIA